MSLLADPAHDQDVVVLTERHRENEQEQRQHEDQPVVTGQVDENDHGEAEGGQV